MQYPYTPEISLHLLGAIQGLRDTYCRIATNVIEGFRDPDERSSGLATLKSLEDVQQGRTLYVDTHRLEVMLDLCNAVNTLNTILYYHEEGLADKKDERKFTQNLLALVDLGGNTAIGDAGKRVTLERGPNLPASELDLSAAHVVSTYWDELNTLVQTHTRRSGFVLQMAGARSLGKTAQRLLLDDDEGPPPPPM